MLCEDEDLDGRKKRFRILAVDDQESILDLYQQILCPLEGERHSTPPTPVFELTFCRYAEGAVEAVRSAIEKDRPFAMAFIDIRLPPGRSGVWAAEQIRKLDPDVGIALITGYEGTDLGEVQCRVPPLDKLLYLEKPFGDKEMWQLALSLCEKWDLDREFQKTKAELEGLVAESSVALMAATEQLEAEIKTRINAEETFRESEENFRNTILNNTDGIIILDKHGIVRFLNPAAESILGRKAESLVGEPFGYQIQISHGELTEIEIDRDNGTLVVEIRVADVKWEGEAAHLASVRDLTEHRRVKHELEQSLKELQKNMRTTVQALALTVERRDHYTAGHQQRVADLSRAIAEEMGVSQEQTEGIYLAAFVHDIGKMGTPTEILVKPYELTELEFKLIEPHPQVAYEILKTIEFSWPIAEIVLQHHERLDGSGYPHGLQGNKILPEARILGVADVVEAMASDRPYRPAQGIDAALGEIQENRDVLYDPLVVDACLKLFSEKGFGFAA